MPAPEEAKQLRDDIMSAFEQFKAANDERLEAIESKGYAPAETTELVDKIEKSISELTEKQAELETKLARPDLGGLDPRSDKEKLQEKQAFDQFLRKGAIEPQLVKALTRGDDTTGGYLAPVEMVAEMIKKEVEFSPIREHASIRTTSRHAIKIPKRTGSHAASWVGETATRSETTGTAFGMEEIPTHEMYALVDVSKLDLEDADFDLEGYLMDEFAEQFGVAEGTAFVSGNAVAKPEGLLTPSGVSTTNSGSAGAFTADGLMDLFYAVKEAYARNGKWLARRASVGAIRKLKNGSGDYLWAAGLAGGQPATILDKPIVECIDMPAIASAAEAAIFGDLKRGYQIVDRLDMEVLRDPYTQASSGLVRFHARKRVGGQVINDEAFRTQTLSA